MTSLGVLLVVLGVGSLILPYLNLQFTLMDWLDPYQPWAGVVVAALGLITILFASRRRKPAEPETATAPAAAAPPAAATPPETASPPEAAAAEPTSEPWPTTPPERRDD
ncbi:MAG TPA: hypothetical protein VIA02_07535 [Candidatus Limnocylindria bacterium]|jgi:hypothetical protein